MTGYALWCPIVGVLSEWWLIAHLIHALLGVSVAPHNSSSPTLPDLLIVGDFASRAASASILATLDTRTAAFYVSSEFSDFAAEHDALLFHTDDTHGADAAWGSMPRLTEAFSDGARVGELSSDAQRYANFPLFLFSAIDREAATAQLAARGADDSRPPPCPLRRELFQTTVPDTWRARPGFTLFVSHHMPDPRYKLYFALNGTLEPRSDHVVDAPGRVAGIRNKPWPADVPNTREGKALLLTRYRFNLAPENSGGDDGHAGAGYVTEKLIEAHIAGSVPIYWGGVEDFPQFFNIARIIRFNETADVNATAVLAAVRSLEDNATARSIFFAQPLLAPSAQEWVNEACARAGDVLVGALRDALLEREENTQNL